MNRFKTFFMGGYECADHINRSGDRINLLEETQHDIRIDQDYKELASIGIKTVREGVCWSSVETAPYIFDFSKIKISIDTAKKYGIQQIWDLCHFGYPDGLFPTHPHFCIRFEALCEAFAFFHKSNTDEPLLVVPINEISFLSWHSGDVRGTVPFAVNSGWDIKYHLCKAAILGIKKLKAIDPNCAVILVEPLIKIHPQTIDEAAITDLLNEDQYQAMDIISGNMCPELGGSPQLFDILGFNHYWDSQWVHRCGPLAWPEENMSHRIPLSVLLEEAYLRYQKPLFISETGHFGAGRMQWIMEVTLECSKAIDSGVDLRGLCIYPVTDRPDWDDLEKYSNCGLFDLDPNQDRIPHENYINIVKLCIQQIDSYLVDRNAISLPA